MIPHTTVDVADGIKNLALQHASVVNSQDETVNMVDAHVDVVSVGAIAEVEDLRPAAATR